jgi:hypothetical protein
MLAAVVVVLLATGVVFISDNDRARFDGPGGRGPGMEGRGRVAGRRSGDAAQAPSSRAAPPSGPDGMTPDGPAGGPTNASGEDIEPASPPVTLPPGAQGPVRPEPCDATGPPANPLPFRDGPSGDGGSWVTVARIEGNCGGSSTAFGVRGVDTRLVFRSDAEQFLVFLDDLVDVDAAAGYADVECRSPCADEQILTIGEGRYRLRVAATDAPWEVLLQEYR